MWEVASREVLGNPRDVPTADLDHIAAVLVTEQPGLVLAFGAVARDALRTIVAAPNARCFALICSPHPAARSVQAQRDFRDAMEHARRLIDSGGVAA